MENIILSRNIWQDIQTDIWKKEKLSESAFSNTTQIKCKFEKLCMFSLIRSQLLIWLGSGIYGCTDDVLCYPSPSNICCLFGQSVWRKNTFVGGGCGRKSEFKMRKFSARSVIRVADPDVLYIPGFGSHHREKMDPNPTLENNPDPDSVLSLW